MLESVFWPNEDALCGDGSVVKVAVVMWDYEAREGKAVIKGEEGSWVDVYVTSYADGDLTIGRRPSCSN